MKHTLEILAGPASFACTAFALTSTFTPAQSFAIGTAVWMALWWILRPVSIYVTAFIPILVDSLFDLIPEGHILSQYFSEIAVLLLGSDLICLTWTTTGLDRRLSVKTLCCIGTSMKNQIFVWFLASTLLSVFLPNVVVAAIFCPIAVAMLHFVGEKDITKSRLALPILLAVGWGSGIGGFGSPIGSSANLVAVSYIEQLTGHEFMYYDWVIRFLPLLAIVFFVNLLFLWAIPVPVKELKGTRSYFQDMYKTFGPLKKGEWIGLTLFLTATILAFARPAFADLLPGWKPAYIFLTLGLFMFFLKDETGHPMLTWKYAESHIMWGMICLFASGLAWPPRHRDRRDRAARLPHRRHASLRQSLHHAISCGFATFLSELSSNTAAASISIPVVTGLAKALGVNPIPYILGSIVAANCAYTLPISTRAIPIGHGLDAAQQIKYGLLLSLITLATTIAACTLFMMVSPLFCEL